VRCIGVKGSRVSGSALDRHGLDRPSRFGVYATLPPSLAVYDSKMRPGGDPMTKEHFLRSIEAIANLDANRLNGHEKFNYAKDWDSLAIVGFLSFVDKEVGTSVNIRDLKSCRTYDELYHHLESLRM